MLPKCLPIQLNEQIEIRLDTKKSKGYTIQTIQTESGLAQMVKFQLDAEVVTDVIRREMFLNGVMLLYPAVEKAALKLVLERISIYGLSDSLLSIQIEEQLYTSQQFKQKLLEVFKDS